AHSFCLTRRQPPTTTLFPYTTLFRSGDRDVLEAVEPPAPRPRGREPGAGPRPPRRPEENRRDERREEGPLERPRRIPQVGVEERSEEHTSELQSRFDLVCRLLLEKKK